MPISSGVGRRELAIILVALEEHERDALRCFLGDTRERDALEGVVASLEVVEGGMGVRRGEIGAEDEVRGSELAPGRTALVGAG